MRAIVIVSISLLILIGSIIKLQNIKPIENKTIAQIEQIDR